MLQRGAQAFPQDWGLDSPEGLLLKRCPPREGGGPSKVCAGQPPASQPAGGQDPPPGERLRLRVWVRGQEEKTALLLWMDRGAGGECVTVPEFSPTSHIGTQRTVQSGAHLTARVSFQGSSVSAGPCPGECFILGTCFQHLRIHVET